MTLPGDLTVPTWRRFLPPNLVPGTGTWEWIALVSTSISSALGVALAVAGTGLTGMGIGLAMHGIGFLNLQVGSSDSEVLVVGVVMMMLGAACLGLAVEGSLRFPGPWTDTDPWKTVTGWLPALLIVLWLVERLEALSASILLGYSPVFDLVPAYLDTVGNRFLYAAPVSLALIWLSLEYGHPRFPLLTHNLPSLLYVPWMVLVTFN